MRAVLCFGRLITTEPHPDNINLELAAARLQTDHQHPTEVERSCQRRIRGGVGLQQIEQERQGLSELQRNAGRSGREDLALLTYAGHLFTLARGKAAERARTGRVCACSQSRVIRQRPISATADLHRPDPATAQRAGGTFRGLSRAGEMALAQLGIGTSSSVCHSPNSLPCGSVQAAGPRRHRARRPSQRPR